MMLLMALACTVTTPDQAAGVALLDDYGAVPAFSFTDETGAAFTDQRLRGKVWLADFFFTSCPDICPVLSAHMAEIQAHYRDRSDFELVSFSVDPVTDTPPVLQAYATKVGGTPGRWHFLTGPLGDIRTVVIDGFKQAIDARPGDATDPATILHGARFVLVDRVGHIRAWTDPKEPEKKTLYAAVDAVLAE